MKNLIFKYLYIFMGIAALTGAPGFAQIVVQSSDMPHVGDTLRGSMTSIVPAGYDQTGMDTTWDFSALQAQSQKVDSFVNVNTTPTAYYIYFGLLNGANLASPVPAIPGLPLTDGFEFYKNQASSYGDMGLAYRTDEIPIIPAKYDNPDIFYQFPLEPGMTWSSTATFSISLPGIGFLSRQKIRNSEADGWGTLITPYGTFPVLRVKSIVNEHDSIYIDSLGMGFPINRNITEYKWLGNGKGLPLLQITEEGLFATATYRDIYRMPTQPLSVTLGPDTLVMHGTTITLTAEVTGGVEPYQYLWSTLETGKSITVTVLDTQTYLVFILDAQQNFGFAQKIITVDYPAALTEPEANGMEAYPNPTDGVITITFFSMEGPVEIKVMNALGKLVKLEKKFQPGPGHTIDLSGLPSGMYYIQATANQKTMTKKIIIKS